MYSSNLSKSWLKEVPNETKWNLKFTREHKELWLDSQENLFTTYFLYYSLETEIKCEFVL